jgi:hypothetical protein
MTQNFESFESFEEVLEYINRANDEFQASPDFALASDRTMSHILTLMSGLGAISRIARIEIKKQHLRLKGGL